MQEQRLTSALLLPERTPVLNVMVNLRHLATKFRLEALLRLQEQSRPAFAWTVRLTGAATAAFVAARLLYPQSDPLLAPLTALLVTQVTLFSIVRHGLDRVLSVVAGVTLAVVFSLLVGLTWWSLGLLIAAALIVGMLLRLGPNLIEVPISAMLVLGVGAAKSGPAAFERIIETLIGAGVGMLINILVPPGVRMKNAGVGVEAFANEIAQTLEDASNELLDDVTKEQASAWLIRVRNFSNMTPGLDGVLRHAEESRRLNVRAIGSPDVGNALRSGLDALEHASVAVRSLFRSVNDVVHFSEIDDSETRDAYPLPSRKMSSDVMKSIATSIREFGKLVHAQTNSPGNVDTLALMEALHDLEDVRIRARELFRSDPLDQPFVHELNVFLVATAGRINRELDPKAHNWLFTPTTPVRPQRVFVSQWRRKAS